MNDTKEHILNAALSLFLRKSFKEVTMKELVEKTGMSKGAFYHYFESKEQLFLEVANNILELGNIDYNKFSKESLYKFYKDYIAHMTNVSESLLKSIIGKDNNMGLNYFALIFDAIKLFPSFREQMLESLHVEINAWKEIVSIARNSGEIKSPMSDEQIGSMFVYSNDGVGMRNIMKGSSEFTMSSLSDLWDSFYEELRT
jgi:TetR/AcrR family transcriptional regulator, transcriptional repressor for nem operon